MVLRIDASRSVLFATQPPRAQTIATARPANTTKARPAPTLNRLARVATPSSAAPPKDREAAVAMADTLRGQGGADDAAMWDHKRASVRAAADGSRTSNCALNASLEVPSTTGGRSPHYTRCPAHLNTVPMLTSMEAASADSTAFWVTCSACVPRRQERALTQHTVQRLVPGRHRDVAQRRTAQSSVSRFQAERFQFSKAMQRGLPERRVPVLPPSSPRRAPGRAPPRVRARAASGLPAPAAAACGACPQSCWGP